MIILRKFQNMSDQIFFLILKISLSKIGHLVIPCVSLYCWLFRQKIGRIIFSGTFPQNCCSSPVPIKSSFWDFGPNFPFHLCHPSIHIVFGTAPLYYCTLSPYSNGGELSATSIDEEESSASISSGGDSSLLRPYQRWWGSLRGLGFLLFICQEWWGTLILYYAVNSHTIMLIILCSLILRS